MIRHAVIVIAVSAMAGQPITTPRPPDTRQPTNLIQLKADINALIAASGAGSRRRVAAAGREAGEEILINPTLRFHAASTMKVPVMIELFRQADVGRLKLDDKVVVTNQFTSIQDGSPFVLAVTDDSDGEVQGTRIEAQLSPAGRGVHHGQQQPRDEYSD